VVLVDPIAALRSGAKAVVLCGGAKSGVSQRLFYKRLVDLADKRYDEHLSELERNMDDLERLIQTLPGDEQRAVAKRAEELVTAHNLRELRALAGRTQEDVSAGTGFKQTNVSRLEKRADMKLSTLRDYVNLWAVL
jgi:hypothetical protein